MPITNGISMLVFAQNSDLNIITILTDGLGHGDLSC